MSATASKVIARWENGDPCPGATCDACPSTGCICPPCRCADCRKRTRIANTGRTPLRRPDAIPARERLFEPEYDPIRAAGAAERRARA